MKQAIKISIAQKQAKIEENWNFFLDKNINNLLLEKAG